jgi:hypothetical protein
VRLDAVMHLALRPCGVAVIQVQQRSEVVPVGAGCRVAGGRGGAGRAGGQAAGRRWVPRRLWLPFGARRLNAHATECDADAGGGVVRPEGDGAAAAAVAEDGEHVVRKGRAQPLAGQPPRCVVHCVADGVGPERRGVVAGEREHRHRLARAE